MAGVMGRSAGTKSKTRLACCTVPPLVLPTSTATCALPRPAAAHLRYPPLPPLVPLHCLQARGKELGTSTWGAAVQRGRRQRGTNRALPAAAGPCHHAAPARNLAGQHQHTRPTQPQPSNCRAAASNSHWWQTPTNPRPSKQAAHLPRPLLRLCRRAVAVVPLPLNLLPRHLRHGGLWGR